MAIPDNSELVCATNPCLSFHQVVGHSYDNCDLEDGDVGTAYETIYALLQCISPSYQLNFKDAVASKLQSVADQMEDK